jgi:hypothetical protein
MSCAKELVTGPVELYWAETGTTFPDIDATPSASWNLIGTLGSRRYTEDGVSVSWDVETEDFVSLGDIDPECVFLTGRNLMVTVTLADLSLDQIRVALNFNATTDTAGPPSTREISMVVGPELTSVALLIRGTGKSPDFEGGNLQFEFANAIEVGSKEVTFEKGAPAGVSLEFRILAGTKRIVAELATFT